MHADQDAVGMITSALATLNSDRLIDEHPADLADFGLDKPAIEVDVTLKGGKTQKLLIGNDTPAGTDTYAKLEGDPKVYTIPTFTKTTFDKIPDRSARQAPADFQSGQTDFRTVAGKGPAVEFGKNAQGDWQITKPKPMRADSLLVDDLIRKLKDAKMDMRPPTRAEAVAESRTKVGTASTTDNPGTQTIEIRKGKTNLITRRVPPSPASIKSPARSWRQSSARPSKITVTRSCSISASTILTKLEINGTGLSEVGRQVDRRLEPV